MHLRVISFQVIIVLLNFGSPPVLECLSYFTLAFLVSVVPHSAVLCKLAPVCWRQYRFWPRIWLCGGHISTSSQNISYILSVSEKSYWCPLLRIQSSHYLPPWKVNKFVSVWKWYILVWHSQVLAILFLQKRNLFSSLASLIWVVRKYVNVFVESSILQTYACPQSQIYCALVGTFPGAL